MTSDFELKGDAGLTTLILGATGSVGRHLLRELLAADSVTKVHEYGRRVSKTDQLPSLDKLEQKTIDFDKIDGTTFKEGNWDVVFITSVRPGLFVIPTV